MSELELTLLLIFAGAGFFFALSETALLTLGKWRLRLIMERRPVSGVLIRKLLAEPHDMLATITLGNTLAHGALIAAAWMIGIQADDWAKGLTLVLLALALLLFCEVVPKTLAVRRPELWAPWVARPVLWFMWFSTPIRRVAQRVNGLLLRLTPRVMAPLPPLSDEEYQELLELACQQGTLALSEKEIILNIMQLDQRTVGELMLPRSRMACVDANLSMSEMLAAARKHRHHRLPIYDGTPDTIVSILNTPRLVTNPEIDLAEAIEFPSFVPEEMNLLDLLKNFSRAKRDMAIVLDEFGGTAGLVTLEDIMSDVIGGRRRDARAREFVMEKLESGKWRLSGSVWLQDFRREYPRLETAPGVDTIGGLVAMRLDIIPPIGAMTEFSGLRFTVQDADARRVKRVLVEALK
jgi:CBS domain containing-hemolysin-like protein